MHELYTIRIRGPQKITSTIVRFVYSLIIKAVLRIRRFTTTTTKELQLEACTENSG